MRAETMAPPPNGPAAVGQHDLRNLEKVRGIFASLAKFVTAQAIYQTNNPHYIRTAQAFEQSFRSYFETENELVLTVAQYRLIWRDQVVYDTGCNTESIAFLLFKDGIGELSIHSAVTRAELDQLATILMSALYSPSSQFDAATALWQAEFASIFYRVLDEPADGASGNGDGSGTAQREQSLRASDHQDIASAQPGLERASDALLETLGTYFATLAERTRPGLDGLEREAHVQETLRAGVSISDDERLAWCAGPRTGADGDELIAFLRLILEFTQIRCTPPVIRDVNDTVERLVHYLRDEGSIVTLTATLELIANLDAGSPQPGFESLPDRIETDLTESAYLVSLAQGFRTGNSPHDVLRYLSLAGENAVPGLCELMARSSDTTLHEKACDVLFSAAGDTLERVVDQFHIENALLAADAVQLLSRISLASIPAVIHRMVSSQDAVIRRTAIDFLVHAGSVDAAQRVCTLLKDHDAAVRIRAYASLERLTCPLVVDEIMSLCFGEEAALKTPEELEHMFRALGKVAGIAALPRLRQMVEKKHYLGTGKARSKRDKLCAITALRYVPGPESRAMLERLCHDSDTLVKTKAAHVLKQVGSGLGSDVYERRNGVPDDGGQP